MDPELFKIGHFESENGRSITLREVIDREKLKHIVMHPEDYELGSRESAGARKTYLLAIINGKIVRLKHDAPAWLREYYGGMRQIMEEVIKLNPDLHKLACESKEKRGTDYNIEGTTVNYVMCSLENKALMAAFDYLTEQEIEVGALVFDGLMIHKKGSRAPDYLRFSKAALSEGEGSRRGGYHLHGQGDG
ncbi:unnamed protein product [Mytilus coruscus]|uniref:Uncharacterized protein n=1 Tax=Mytilus coruscus TaxID=42192 RepID=A0A6J8ERC4_MYTCO|nr:unnamed protein product [Mytilus coruscus]